MSGTRVGARVWSWHVVSLILLTWVLVGCFSGAIFGVVWWRLGIVNRPLTLPQALTGALALVTALGASAALVVNARRQDLAERADAREVETLFTVRFREGTAQLAAAEQPERLAGVYALTTLSEDYPQRASLCADVLSGYLRIERHPATHNRMYSGDESSDPSGLDEAIWDAIRGDFEVRSAIQREIARLTSSTGGSESWSHLRIDLSRAVLVDLDLTNCNIKSLCLDSAVLIGKSDLSEAVFGTFSAVGTLFNNETWWSMTTAGIDDVPRIEARFEKGVEFSGLSLPSGAEFKDCVFEGDAFFLGLDGASRMHQVRFDDCTFSPHTYFDEAHFGGGVIFARCQFAGEGPSFDRAIATFSRFTENSGLLHDVPPEMNRAPGDGSILRPTPANTGVPSPPIERA